MKFGVNDFPVPKVDHGLSSMIELPSSIKFATSHVTFFLHGEELDLSVCMESGAGRELKTPTLGPPITKIVPLASEIPRKRRFRHATARHYCPEVDWWLFVKSVWGWEGSVFSKNVRRIQRVSPPPAAVKFLTNQDREDCWVQQFCENWAGFGADIAPPYSRAGKLAHSNGADRTIRAGMDGRHIPWLPRRYPPDGCWYTCSTDTAKSPRSPRSDPGPVVKHTRKIEDRLSFRIGGTTPADTNFVNCA